MFAKFKELRDGLERSMAEEQARHKVSTEQKPDTDKSGQGSLENAPPAAFEKIFKDASDTPKESPPSSSPSDGSKPAAPGTDAKPNDDDSRAENTDAVQTNDGDTNKATGAPAPEAAPGSTLPPDIVKKIKKLNKIEGAYPSLLRSYKIAHSRVAAIDSFEQALREHTPFTSIKEPESFVQYFRGIEEQKKMTTEELRRVSEEKQNLADKLAASQKDLTDELPKLQAQLASKDDEVAKLTAEVDSLKEERSTDKATIDKYTELVEEKADLEHDLSELRKSNEEKETQLKDLEAKYAARQAEVTAQKTKLEAVAKQWEENASKQRLPLSTPTTSTPSTAPSASASKKGGKKNKKNQKKGGTSHAPAGSQRSESPEPPQLPSNEETGAEALRAEIVRLKEDIAGKDVQIEKLNKQRRNEEDLLEDKTMLQEQLGDIGNENCDLKRQIKELESRVSVLDAEFASSREALKQAESASGEWKAKYVSASKEVDDLKVQLQTIQSELGAAQKLAQERFDNLTRAKDSVARIQAENKALKQNSVALEAANKQIESLQIERRAFEKQEKEVVRLQRESSDRQHEINTLHEVLATKKKEAAAEEEKRRGMVRSMSKLEAERDKAHLLVEKNNVELQAVQAELSKLQPEVKRLEQELAEKNAELNRANGDVDLKTRKCNNAEKLLASMRHQHTELETRLREENALRESIEEELANAQKHLADREGEAQSMRRMMADAKKEADSRVADMRSRMEAAVQERDTIEEKCLADARKHSREIEEYKAQIKDKDGRLSPLREQYAQLEARHAELVQGRERQGQVEAGYEDTISNLRSALDASEKQTREFEKLHFHLKKLLDAAHSEHERVKKELKELKALQSKPRSSTPDVDPTGATGDIRLQLWKNTLLQLLQTKEASRRLKMVGYFKEILKLNEDELKQFKKAVEHLSIRG